MITHYMHDGALSVANRRTNATEKEYIQVESRTIDIYAKKTTSPYLHTSVHGPHYFTGLLQINEVSIITRLENEITVDRQVDASLNGRSRGFYGIYSTSTTCQPIIYILEARTLGIDSKKIQPPLKLRRWNARGDPVPPKKKTCIPGSLSLSLSLSLLHWRRKREERCEAVGPVRVQPPRGPNLARVLPYTLSRTRPECLLHSHPTRRLPRLPPASALPTGSARPPSLRRSSRRYVSKFDAVRTMYMCAGIAGCRRARHDAMGGDGTARARFLCKYLKKFLKNPFIFYV